MGVVIFRNGVRHRMEKCLDCGANARGPGTWVPHAEHGGEDGLLPVFADYTRKSDGHQPSLFDGL